MDCSGLAVPEMPGIHLNDVERRLGAWWMAGCPGIPHPALVGITVDGGASSLRGIDKSVLRFGYPLSVICGTNGSGKTTMLALAALAYHAPVGLVRSQVHPSRRNYYTFSEFFYKGPNDAEIVDVTITWDYVGNQFKITKGARKWMHYDRRPRRPVYFLGAARALPAAEQGPLRNHFGSQFPTAGAAPLDPTYLNRISNIMNRAYASGCRYRSARYAISGCVTDATYSSFNMGAGEAELFTMFHLLQEAPEGSLVVVEEIELSLHPEAQTRLARNLLEVSLEKKLQLVVSSHSEHFIDSVPRQARILLQRTGGTLEATQGPTTRFASANVTGRADPELVLYCEDNVAALLIQESLTGTSKPRASVLPVGGNKDAVAAQGRAHLRSRNPRRAILVFDGDVTEAEMQRLLGSASLTPQQDTAEHAVLATALPGGAPPEVWIAQLRDSDAGRAALRVELNVTVAQAASVVADLRTAPNPHDGVFVASRRLNMDPTVVQEGVVRAAARLPVAPLAPLGDRILAALDDSRLIPASCSAWRTQ